MDFSTFPKYKPELFEALDEVLARDIPEIMNMLPKPSDAEEGKEEDDEGENPFAEVQLVKGTATWRITAAHKAECDNVFSTLKQNNGKASGSAVKAVLMKSDLEMNDLRKIWTLASLPLRCGSSTRRWRESLCPTCCLTTSFLPARETAMCSKPDLLQDLEPLCALFVPHCASPE